MGHPARHGMACKKFVIAGKYLLKALEHHGVGILRGHDTGQEGRVGRLPSNRGRGWSARMI